MKITIVLLALVASCRPQLFGGLGGIIGGLASGLGNAANGLRNTIGQAAGAVNSVATGSVEGVENEVGNIVGWKSGLKVRFGVGGFGTDHYVTLPLTVSEAKDQDWTQEERADKPLPSLVMYCHSSYIICVMYDDTEYAAGIQVALPANDFQYAQWDWNVQGYIRWNPSNGRSYWTKQQYFVNEEYLKISASQRVSTRDKSSLLSVGGSVWVSGNRGELFEITKRPDHLLANGFTEQGCIPGMGLHYWRLNKTSECDAEMFPWFTLNDRAHDLIGTGLSVPGYLDPKDLEKDWFERPPVVAVMAVVPRGPQCVYDLAGKPGFTTIHIFYVSEPWLSLCVLSKKF
ncbi:hypothetical protein O0L34_g17963 [Tuta absoluta]|nr:hypothetical protein O0L34_g17963 [Tuta absoluta]